MNNVAQLITSAAAAVPHAAFGTFRQQDRLDRVVERARAVADQLSQTGLVRGDVVAVIGHNSGAYLVTWMATQFAGLQAALINPAYPDELLGAMLDDLAPRGIFWVGRDPGTLAQRKETQVDMQPAWDSTFKVLHTDGHQVAGSGTGLDCELYEISAYIHTSGTTGRPKFCALSHGYFLRLGRFFADTFALSPQDTVCAPLPLFHINPMGYGVLGALTAHSALLSTEKFSAAEFWPDIKNHGVTALVLHAPPANLLKAKTTAQEADGHQVRIGFLCDQAFLRQFKVPIGVGAYGSTEAGGLCHTWLLRPDDDDLPVEGASHLAGRARYDFEHKIAEDGEIWVRGKSPLSLFSGYAKGGRIEPQTDADGWFRTGDRGRLDEYGRLVFVERISESIRINGEYVPIDFVESRLKQAKSLGEFALWRVDSPSKGHDVVLYTTATDVDHTEVRKVLADMPKYMHPGELIRIAQLPRDPGIGKVQRRLLNDQPRLVVTKL
ncbi:class I adenylate-forming enzyme family protein [Diaphorobacter caeni]|uniref:class I adenylate-forming enzyme family protein n=1 Tax=Diaphorobacter caeni TaxID=2784387 RepID=UPI00188FF479|nr:class I adenylate-forming enzyme family protein [Diaphorobacter caeni]MBF5006905.1 acyl--CoA ligase [Diaphorobacter caeni]